MAYFRVTQKQSGGGSGATITVNYDSSFYGKTITCSDGTTTYTSTTTSSGSTTFNVNAEGTWTISCDGTSKTVEVVLSYDVSLTITKTITVYSAASDTLSFTDSTGSKTVTTNSSGSGSVSITYNDGDVIEFTSSVAKDPYDLTSYYSKQITMAAATTEIYVMPNDALYWWGYISDNLEQISSANGWSSTLAMRGATMNTISFNTKTASGSYGYNGLGTKNPIASAKKFLAVARGITASNNTCGSIRSFASKTLSNQTNNVAITQSASAQKFAIDTSDLSDIYMTFCSAASGGNLESDWYAAWYSNPNPLANFFSAANDTVYYISGGVNVVVAKTDDFGGAVVNLSNIPAGVTLYSSVADDPSNLANHYSKQFSVGIDNKFYLMPDNALYWYGYMNGAEILSSANTWGTSGSVSAFKDPTLNTNHVDANTSSTACYCGIGSTSKCSGSKICSIVKGVTATSSVYGSIWADTVKTIGLTSSQIVTSVDTASKKKYEISISADSYCAAFSSMGGTASSRAEEIYALWYE